MPEGPATVLGGLPVIAEVSFYRGDGWTTDDDAEVDGLYWMKSDGTKGAPLSQKIMDRIEKEPYWECDVIEKVSDHLAYEQYEKELMSVRCKWCEGSGKSPPFNPIKRCRRCKGSGTFVSRVRAGLSDWHWD